MKDLNKAIDNRREEILYPLAEKWLERAEAQGLKPHTKAYKKQELEFFLGATMVLDILIDDSEKTCIDPIVMFAGMRGDNIALQLIEMIDKKS